MSENYVKYGDQSYKWAFEDATRPAIPGMKITEMKIEGEPEFNEKAQGDEGLSVVRVKTEAGKDVKTFTASGYLLDAEDFDGASTFEFRGRFYVILKRGEAYNHKGLQMCDFSGESDYLIQS